MTEKIQHIINDIRLKSNSLHTQLISERERARRLEVELNELTSQKNVLEDEKTQLNENVIKLKSLKVFAGTGEPQKAEMTLEVYGKVKNASETGDGPVDAIFKCIKNLYPHDVNLLLYNVHAVTEGTDAQATVSVRIEEKGKSTVGQAADTDTLVASANAYLNALNKLIIKRTKTAPDENLSAQTTKG